MTGTPISNSAVEMYTMLRYLAAKELKELGLEHFDAFRAQYVSAEPGFEPTESGRLKEVTRLGRSWSNMRSLMDLYYSVTDAVTIDDIKKAYAEETLELEDAHAVDDVVGQIDACLDLIYFAMGTLRKIGLTSEEAAESFVAVHNCNMRKKRGRVEGRGSDEDAAKPADWSGPEEAIRAIIARRSSM